MGGLSKKPVLVMIKYIDVYDSELTRTVDEFGTVRWRNNVEQLHRTNGPAIEWADGGILWCYNGQVHKGGNLPAVIWANGDKEYWYGGVRYYPEIIKIDDEEILL